MLMSRNEVLHEEKLEGSKLGQHEEYIKLHKKHSAPLPQNLDFKSKKLILWIPIIAALLFILFGIMRRSISQQQKFYCYKSAFIPTGFNQRLTGSSQSQILVNTRYGFQLYIDPYDNKTSKQIAKRGTFQPKKVNLMGQIIKQGDNVLMIGQSVGLNAVVSAKVIGQKGKLFVLTDNQVSENLINKNVKLNQVQKITTVKRKGTSDHSYKGSIEILNPYGDREITQIQYDEVDKVLPSNIQLHFAYINVQKMEVQTLLGMRKIIKRSSELVLLVEWQYAKQAIHNKDQIQTLIALLSELGYKVYLYKGGSHGSNCNLGTFEWKGELSNLENVKAQTLIFFPDGYALPT